MHITKITFHRFKKYSESTIKLNPGISLLAGGNNSGKSTLLQGLAVWEFCKTVLETERGRQSISHGHMGQGIGISSDDFSPLNIPSLKHLWTNLKTQKINEEHGYTLSIRVDWQIAPNHIDHLTIGLSLVNDRLFIKALDSTINKDTLIPKIAYIPSFAGISSNEPRYTPAIIRRFIGQGLPGAVIRNILLDLYSENIRKRKEEQKERGRKKLRKSFLKKLRAHDPFERLQQLLQMVFSYGIKIKEFNELYHTKINIEIFRGEIRNSRFVRIKDYKPRDLMVEGSGFLQWLTVISLALTPKVNVILLDEPDAHLHPSLQEDLLKHLDNIAKDFSKQILYSTHSSELIRSHEYSMILDTNELNPKYLSTPEKKISLLAGIGSNYTPKLSEIQERRKILFVENESDFTFIKTFAATNEIDIGHTFVVWPWASGHKERKLFFLEMKKIIPDLLAISIVDRDMEAINSVTESLMDKTFPDPKGDDGPQHGFYARKWRRRHIESYLLHPDPIARAADVEPNEIIEHITSNFAVDLSGRYTGQNEPEVILQCNAKEIIETSPMSIKKKYGISKFRIAEEFQQHEICQDIVLIIEEINSKLT